jgi:hypothetical protein
MNCPRSDRRRAFALRAFPPRWRERHGDEFLHVAGELASAPNRDATWSEFVDIVRGGLAVRIEDRPPLRVRVAYRWAEKAVPVRWHAWMRDDLRGRFLGYRRNFRTMLPLLVFVAFVESGTDGPSRTATVAIISAILIAMGPSQARRVRRRISEKVGYDVMAAGLLPPPTPLPTPVVRRPTPRAPYVRYAVPLAAWSSMAGIALIAGAAISNAPSRSIGPVTFSPDPNSPLTTHQAGLIGLAVAFAAVLVAGTTAVVTRARVRNLGATTAHASSAVKSSDMWVAATAVGLPATLLGAVGVMPDIACAAVGVVLVITAAAAGAAAFVVARRDAELGRHISLAELLVGERAPANDTVR